MTQVVVLDIEGTTSATAFVVSTLFPYARARYASYLAEHRSEPRVLTLIADVRRELDNSRATDADVVAALEHWTDTDAKITPLKTLQGWIWQQGFAGGELTAHFFADVIPALRAWHDRGLVLVIFSSGSVDAQRAWFAHTPAGDLSPLVHAYFDTENAGSKREPASYRTIAAAVAMPSETITFLSDARAELDAARAAGWHTIGVCRAGEPASAVGIGVHREIHSFAEVTFLD